MEALIYKIENEPNYQRYSDYGTPEGAYHVIVSEELTDIVKFRFLRIFLILCLM
jgi:hypothetical protein